MQPMAPEAADPGLDQPMLAALQDELLTASTDLERLQQLLADAVEQLMGRFVRTSARFEDALGAGGAEAARATAGVDADAVADVRRELAGAVVALQFQDMSAQLLTHTMRRIHSVADALGNCAMPFDGEDAAPVEFVARPCPVAQRQMDAGSVELF